MDGVIQAIPANCGDSAVPLFGAAYDNLEKSVAEYGNLSLTWNSIGMYLERVEQMGLSTNYVTFLGYGTLPASVIGYAMRARALSFPRVLKCSTSAFAFFSASRSLSFSGSVQG